jgi:hypothetical protein
MLHLNINEIFHTSIYLQLNSFEDKHFAKKEELTPTT